MEIGQIYHRLEIDVAACKGNCWYLVSSGIPAGNLSPCWLHGSKTILESTAAEGVFWIVREAWPEAEGYWKFTVCNSPAALLTSPADLDADRANRRPSKASYNPSCGEIFRVAHRMLRSIRPIALHRHSWASLILQSSTGSPGRNCVTASLCSKTK